MPFAQPLVSNPYPYAYAQTLTTANQLYDITQSLVAGVYTISWSGGGTINIDFYNGTTYVGTATGTSSITYNLAQSITNYKMWNSVGNVSIVIALTALALAPVSGVVTTYTTSQTITAIGDAYAVLVGGGGSGSGGSITNQGGGGGGSGAIVFGRVVLTGNRPLVVGQGGAAQQGASSIGNPGTATTFAGLTAPGASSAVSFTSGGIGGVPNGVNGGGSNANGAATSTLATITSWPFFTQGSTGSGGGGGNPGTPGTGAGSGLGTGGSGGNLNGGSGYGSGGGGGNGASGLYAFGGAGGNGCLILIV